MSKKMTPVEFWQRVDQIIAQTRNRPSVHSPKTKAEQFATCGDFLVDIDLLASDWYTNRIDEPLDDKG